MATKTAQKAELLNKYFCSVFLSATPDVNTDPTNNPLRTDMEISQIQVSVDDVTKHLSALDTSKACGPDGISARLLKECSQQIKVTSHLSPNRASKGHGSIPYVTHTLLCMHFYKGLMQCKSVCDISKE